MSDSLNENYDTVIQAIVEGRVVPFLGAGANLWGRHPTPDWQPGQGLPSGSELAAYLAERFHYPATGVLDRAGAVLDLARVSQYVELKNDLGPLYEALRDLFITDYPPNQLHQFLADIPSVLREKGYPRTDNPLRNRLVIVTTNYDDLLETAFKAVHEKFHVVAYLANMAKPEQCGRFLHWPPDGSKAKLVKGGKMKKGSLGDRCPMILKIHGTVTRPTDEYDSFVITEDHYIDYLARRDISNELPVGIRAILMKSHFLFLGYSLRDWNLRALLRRISAERKLPYKSWAIQLNPEELDKEFWDHRNVEIHNVPLEEYVAELSKRLRGLPPAGRQR
jgi:SIR2-like protein